MVMTQLLTYLTEDLLPQPLDARQRASLTRGLRTIVAQSLLDEAAIDALIASLDVDLSRQLDAILHHPTFQALESAWRGLWLVVSRIAADQNIRCEVLNCSKEDLLLDFDDSPELPKSGLYRLVYSAEFGPFGGRPHAAIVANYEIFGTRDDIAMLRQCSHVGFSGSAPFLAGAAPSLLGRESAHALAEGGRGALSEKADQAWRDFRSGVRARFAGLVSSRILGRSVYENDGSTPHRFRHRETISRPEDHLWINGVFALTACIARSFELFRLAANITGPVGGLVEDLPTWRGPRGSFPKPAPLEAPLSASRIDELEAAGIIALAFDEAAAHAYFPSAPSCLSPSATMPADLAPADRDLHRQIPGLFVVGRLMQHLKVVHRERIGAWHGRETLERELRAVLDGLVHRPIGAADDHRELHTKKVLHAFDFRVEEPPPGGGYSSCSLRLTPNWSAGGRFFTLAIDSFLDCE
ncbi:Hypothetical protein A7982_09016 [Minicystis rosea]|nr:Hypothetical protein A7982_09016 [Minicystis rosea]